MRRRPFLLALALLLLPTGTRPAPVHSQEPVTTRVEEETAVRAVLEQVFRGMREADSAMVRAAFHTGARFASAARDGAISYDAVDGWLRAIATSGGRWDERIYDVEVEVDPPVASAWVPYTFYLDGQLSHCGANTVELLRTPAGWKITQLSDSRRREGCPDPRAAPGGDEVVVFRDVSVLPMDAERVVPGQTVIVRGDRIEWVGATEDARIPGGATVVEGRGRYLMPGLSEMHAHIPGASASPQAIEDLLFLYIANGVTTIRGMLGAPNQLELRERAGRGEILSPTIMVGAPSLNGNSAPDPATGVRLVRQHKATGYDFLKLHPGLSRETYDAVVEAAREEGITLGGHVSTAVGLERTLEARQGSIDHLDGYVEAAVPAEVRRRILSPTEEIAYGEVLRALDPSRIPELAAATREAGVANVPTAALWEAIYGPESAESLAARPEMRYVSRQQVQGWIQQKRNQAASQANSGIGPREAAAMLDFRRRLLKALADAGAPLLLGTDSPQLFSVPGFALHREAALLQEAGVSPWKVLESGTRNVGLYSRDVLGQPEAFGLVAPGHRADLVLLQRNPLDDVGNLRSMAGVMVRGRWLDQGTIDAGLAEIVARHGGG